jgi:hypothetical protein
MMSETKRETKKKSHKLGSAVAAVAWKVLPKTAVEWFLLMSL